MIGTEWANRRWKRIGAILREQVHMGAFDSLFPDDEALGRAFYLLPSHTTTGTAIINDATDYLRKLEEQEECHEPEMADVG